MKNISGIYKNIFAGTGILLLVWSSPLLALDEIPEAKSTTSAQSTEQHEPSLQLPPSDSAAPSDDGTRSVPAATETVIEPKVVTPIAGRVAAPVATAPKINPGANLLNLVLGLALIVGLIIALSWLMRRMGNGGLLTSNQIKVVAAMPLGTRERIVVIEVGGQQLLLGITATQINALHVFPEPVIDSQQATGQSEFSKKLMAVLQQKTTPQSPSPAPGEPRQ